MEFTSNDAVMWVKIFRAINSILSEKMVFEEGMDNLLMDEIEWNTNGFFMIPYYSTITTNLEFAVVGGWEIEEYFNGGT